MASMRMLVFVTMLFCLFKVGFTGAPPGIKFSTSNSGSNNKIRAGYYSQATLWHGVKARFGIWDINNDVDRLSSSGAYIGATNQSPGLEMIAAGFHVNPSLYGDKSLHFFTYWTTTNDYSTGCYNNLCPGFVLQNGASFVPGATSVRMFSKYDKEEFLLVLNIKKDEKTGDWSLYIEDSRGRELLGWWPKTLFKSLSNHAETIEWTGFVSHDSKERRPPMGSGRFANELNNRAASISDCFGFDEHGNGFEGKDYKPLANIDKPACYSVSQWYQTKHSAQRHFFYGGPGGCTQ
ncbi:protein neprosin-like [Carex rostrata]